MTVAPTLMNAFYITALVAQQALKSFRLLTLYGPSGLLLYYFGSLVTWRVEAQVLGQLDDDEAMQFKKSVQDECTMVSVAAAIVAQIAITGLSLNGLSQAHWTAKGFLVFSLTSALMAVYYATTQQRALGRVLRAKQVREWIRGHAVVRARGKSRTVNFKLKDGILGFLVEMRSDTIPAPLGDLWKSIREAVQTAEGKWPQKLSDYDWNAIMKALEVWRQPPRELLPCDPRDLDVSQVHLLTTPGFLRRKCFTPSVLSVITISAPQMLLSASLLTLLVGFGVYLGFTWTRKLDTLAALHDSRNVFIMYLVGLGVCIFVYSISRIVQETDLRTEHQILEDHVKEYVTTQKASLETAWGVTDLVFDDKNQLRFKQLPEVLDQEQDVSTSSSAPHESTAPVSPRPQSLPETSHDIFNANSIPHTMTV
ncbi:hypothetical protein E2P81_ATG06669 [Venturia nashicola]|nr:hypothetical protein E2P81_ATG06669 [Venturia nashicola]